MFQSGDYINVLWSSGYERYVGDWTLGRHNGTGSLGDDLEAVTRNIISHSKERNLTDVIVMSRTRGRLSDRDNPISRDDFELMFLFLNDPEYNPTGIRFSREMLD